MVASLFIQIAILCLVPASFADDLPAGLVAEGEHVEVHFDATDDEDRVILMEIEPENE